ncbi:hypothetical protein PGB90_003286 [Kerria lacca]
MNSNKEFDNETHYFEQNNDEDTLIPPEVTRRKFHLIEPVIFFVLMATSLFEAVLQNAIELQYCSSVLNIPQSQCSNTTTEIENQIQRFTTVFQTVRSVFEVGIPCILSFFAGPWSDTHGRKPLLLASLIGYFISYALWTWGTSLTSLPPHYFILFSIPSSLCGGFTLLILSSFCYVCDITTIHNRSHRLGLLQAFLYMGAFIGIKLIPSLNNYSYSVIFAISASIVYMSLMYTYFFVHDSIQLPQSERMLVSRNPFKLSNVKNLFESCYSKQTPKNRLIISITIMVMTASMIQYTGESSIMYFFMQRIFKSTLDEYTNLLSFGILINAVGSFGGTLLFSRILKCDDLYLLCVSAFIRIIAPFPIIFGWEIWHLYFSKLLGITTGLIGPLCRSFLSRMIPPDELGKIFSLIASTESSMPMFATFFYSITYNITINSYPTAVFMLSAFFGLLILFFLILLVELYLHPVSNLSTVTQERPTINP